MKKLLPLALTLTLALTACTGTAQTTPAPAASPAAASTPEVTAAPAPTATPAATPTRLPTPEPTPAPALPMAPLEFSFASGAGGWSTFMLLNPDGTFEGHFHDSDMGSTGEGYPGGTYYYSDFHGRFTDIKERDGGIWTLTLDSVETEAEPGWEEIRQVDYGGEQVGILYVSSDPYGMDGGKDFILYPPDTPLEGLDEEFLSWWPGRYEGEGLTTLCCYGLWNKDMGYGFFSTFEFPEGFISSYDEFAARTAALEYYENTAFEVDTTPRIDVPAGWEGEIAFQVKCSKDGVPQDPDRIITLSRVDGVWTVVSEGY